MKSKLLSDFQSDSDGSVIVDANELDPSFIAGPAGLAAANAPHALLAATASPNADSTPMPAPDSLPAGWLLVPVSLGGITINIKFDADAAAAPESFRAGIEQAATLLAAVITDNITVNIIIGYGGTGRGALGGPDNVFHLDYSTVRADLINHASAGDTTFNALPAGSSIQGQTSVDVFGAQAKLWGLL